MWNDLDGLHVCVNAVIVIVDHHCLNFLCFVDIGGIIDHHCLSSLFIMLPDT